MKRILVACFLLILIVVSCFFSYRYLDSETRKIEQSLTQSNRSLRHGDRADAIRELKKTKRKWQANRMLLGSLIRHAEMDEIDQMLERAQSYLQEQNDDDYYVESAALEQMLNHLVELESISIQNIF